MRHRSLVSVGEAISRTTAHQRTASCLRIPSRPLSCINPTYASSDSSITLPSQKRSLHLTLGPFSSRKNLIESAWTTRFTQQTKPQRSQARHCSYRRRMCRKHEAEVAESNMDITKGREVLPKNVTPRHYDLTLEPDFKTFKYQGTVVIE